MAGKWKHGYIPLDGTAALEKAHGSKTGAAKALKAGGGKASVPKAPKAPAVRAARPKPKAMTPPKQAEQRVSPGQLSKTYVSGKGATKADVATLARNYEIMHGKKPTAKQLGKIRRAK